MALQDSGWLIAQAGVFGPYISALITGSLFGLYRRRDILRHMAFVFVPAIITGIYISKEYQEYKHFDALDLLVLSISVISILAFFIFRDRRANVATGPSGTYTILVSIFLLPLVYVAGWFIIRDKDSSSFVFADDSLKYFFQFLLIRFAVNLIHGGSLGEEMGWRGFALPQLMRQFTPLHASCILGLAWGLWHLPLDLAAGFGYDGILAIIGRLFFVIPLSIIFTLIYVKSRLKITNMLLLHTSVNMISDFGLTKYENGMQVFLISVILLSVLFVYVFRKSMTKKPGTMVTD